MKLDEKTLAMCEALRSSAGPVGTAEALRLLRNFIELFETQLRLDRLSCIGYQYDTELPPLDETVAGLSEAAGIPQPAMTKLIAVLVGNGCLGKNEEDGETVVFHHTNSVKLLGELRTELDTLCAQPLEVDTIAELIAIAKVAVTAGRPFHHHVHSPGCHYNSRPKMWEVPIEVPGSDGKTVVLAFISEEKPNEEDLGRLEELAVKSRS